MSILTTIDGIAAGGAGVGRLPDGRAVFVHRTAPGEEVAIRVTEEKRRWARGDLLAVRTASADRRTAPCRFYARCGGCTLEHLHYNAQLAAKAKIVADALRRIGARDVALPHVVPSPREFHYRNRVSFTLLRLSGDRVVAGFHELERPGHVLDISGACLLPEPIVAEAWDALRAHWGAGAVRLPAGSRLRLTVRATAEGQAAVLVEGGHGRGQPEDLLRDAPPIAAIWHRRTAGEQPALLAGQPSISESWTDETVELTGGVFLQVNREAAALLEDHVLEVAGDVNGMRIIDAYCGVGLHARRLARAGGQVVGIELDAEAVREARRSSGGEVEYHEGDVAELLPSLLPADLVVINPPRAGMATRACDAVRAQPPRRTIYISCDPATLARDLSRLGASFEVKSMRCFDLFPQTAHVETVMELECVIS